MKTGSVVGYPGSTEISNEDVLAYECDILIPAALENQINTSNMKRINARVIAEAANGPTTPAADRILAEKGIPVLPDILANHRGVTYSLEGDQKNQREALATMGRGFLLALVAIFALLGLVLCFLVAQTWRLIASLAS